MKKFFTIVIVVIIITFIYGACEDESIRRSSSCYDDYEEAEEYFENHR